MTIDKMKALIGSLIILREKDALIHEYSNEDLPNLAATEPEIAQLEKSLHIKLPAQYRTFLACANGWNYVFASTSLLSTDEVPYAQNLLREWPWLKQALQRKRYKDYSVIGTSDNDDAVILITKKGLVLEYASGEVGEFPDFETFFESLIVSTQIAVDNPTS